MGVLIIGGTGLISTGITRQLIAAGYDVTTYTRGQTDADVPDSVERVTGDRTDNERFRQDMARLDIDCVIDMIGFDPAEIETAISIFGGEVNQYVFCSTIDVYHRPVEDMPVTESASREPPVSDYGAKKTTCENLLFEAYRTTGFPMTIIRPWDTYGEGGILNDTLACETDYIARLRAGDPIVVHGDGSTVCAPCHRDDVASAFVGAVGNQKAISEAYHTTGEHPMTWDQYHRRAAAALDAPEPELVHVPTDVLKAALPDRTESLSNHFQFSVVFDTAKARRDLDFTQTVGLEEGVRRTVSWLDERDRVPERVDDPEYDRLISAWRSAEESVVETVRNGQSKHHGH